MAVRRVWTFFYGSYMNLDVLRSVRIAPERVEVARLPGHALRIEPRANVEDFSKLIDEALAARAR